MYTRQRKQSFLRRLILPGLSAALLLYFALHALSGDYGLIARGQLENNSHALERKLADLKQKRETLERRVVLLRPESLDPDMIDERARDNLNLVHPDEIVILRNDRSAQK
ncbi:septum formation initiator family protein [Breoghania sp.]|uniref:FtsB family cell division protein n=1 Tax=Breoghania sp. TaxID=2065378 RepID=UPI002609DA3E|nr:septum formation initiator family protein [Breoghania sp.]MDJ0930763.1 septum formation initiator family protein [Breoghania sp.]